nr:MAG TPA: hypothetical protein [Caudoviricetes sp.]
MRFNLFFKVLTEPPMRIYECRLHFINPLSVWGF